MNELPVVSSDSQSHSRYMDYCARVAGTTIDDRTLLSTDYFNSFNEIVMLLGMVADMPEALEDIQAWKFRTYEEHFYESNLPFGPLAIEAYACSPAEVRLQFDKLILELRHIIENLCQNLKPATNADELFRLKLDAQNYSRCLQGLIEIGSGIVHGASMNVDQAAIDRLF